MRGYFLPVLLIMIGAAMMITGIKGTTKKALAVLAK